MVETRHFNPKTVPDGRSE